MADRLPALGGVALGLGALLYGTFDVRETLDYGYQVAPAMNALLEGDLGEFMRLQPVYGGFALLARLPFAALVKATGGGELLVYQVGAVVCVLALAAAALAVTKAMGDRGRPASAQVAVGGLLVMNPVSLAAVQRGHPEELLTCALVLGAVLAAVRSRPLWAAVLLGLALGTKQWAFLAALPVLLLCRPGHALRAALVAAAVAAALTVPMAVGDPGRFSQNNRMAQGGWFHASRMSVWWPLSSPEKVSAGAGEGFSYTVHRLPDRLTTLARPFVAVLAIALAVASWRRRQGLGPEDTLALLALVLLLRCLLDPLNNDYYHAPLLAFLAAWEGLRTRGLPVLSLLAAAALWATLRSPWLSPHALGEQFQLVNNALYLAWTLPLAAWLAFVVFRSPIRDASTRRPGAGRHRKLRASASRWDRAPQSSAP